MKLPSRSSGRPAGHTAIGDGLRWGLVMGAIILMLHGCGRVSPPPRPVGYPKPYKVMGRWYQPLPHARGYRQRGVASWYGDKFHGRRTSSGEIYNMYAMTAAHKTLPLGTMVRVRNLNNHRSVTVRINDRGPFVRSRIIDLSYAAAKKLGMLGPGTASVEIEAIGMPVAAVAGKSPSYRAVDYYSGNFTFQVGAFQVRANAEKLRRQLGLTYSNAHIVSFFDGRQTWYRVRVGSSSDLNAAVRYERYLNAHGFPQAFVVAE